MSDRKRQAEDHSIWDVCDDLLPWSPGVTDPDDTTWSPGVTTEKVILTWSPIPIAGGTCVTAIIQDVWRNVVRRFLSIEDLIALSCANRYFHKVCAPAISTSIAKRYFGEIVEWQAEDHDHSEILLSDCRSAYNYMRFLEKRYPNGLNKTKALKQFVLDKSSFGTFIIPRPAGHEYPIRELFCACLMQEGTFEAFKARESKRVHLQVTLAATRKRKRREEQIQARTSRLNIMLERNGYTTYNVIWNIVVPGSKDITLNPFEWNVISLCADLVPEIDSWIQTGEKKNGVANEFMKKLNDLVNFYRMSGREDMINKLRPI